MKGFLQYLGDKALWFAAVVLAAAPTRLWPRLERNFPVESAAFMSGIATLFTGFFLDLFGFLAYGSARAFARNDRIMEAVHRGDGATATTLSDASAALIILTLIEFVFMTPLGLFATYLLASGTVRAMSAWADDPRGDPILSFVDWAVVTLFRKNRLERQHRARERREGPDAPDVLRTGDWAGLHGVDYVVLAARRKAEWHAGAIVMTGEDWYKLGVPFDLDTPAGLRTVYPLTKMETVEVVRRGIQYELPKVKGGRQA